MVNTKKENIPQLFDKLFKTLSGSRFINREGLGGNKPIFIQPYEIAQQVTVDEQIQSLIKRLNAANVPVLAIDLYNLCLDVLKAKGTLQKVLENEQNLPKREFKRNLQGSLSVKDNIMPYIQEKMKESEHRMVFIYGIDKVYQQLSMVPVLVNIQSLLNNEPFIFFYPGLYDNYSLNLFGSINEDNEYRAFNLNNYN
jgi:hypothetical protein